MQAQEPRRSKRHRSEVVSYKEKTEDDFQDTVRFKPKRKSRSRDKQTLVNILLGMYMANESGQKSVLSSLAPGVAQMIISFVRDMHMTTSSGTVLKVGDMVCYPECVEALENTRINQAWPYREIDELRLINLVTGRCSKWRADEYSSVSLYTIVGCGLYSFRMVLGEWKVEVKDGNVMLVPGPRDVYYLKRWEVEMEHIKTYGIELARCYQCKPVYSERDMTYSIMISMSR